MFRNCLIPKQRFYSVLLLLLLLVAVLGNISFRMFGVLEITSDCANIGGCLVSKLPRAPVPLEFVCTNLHKSKIAAKFRKYVHYFLRISHHEITFVDCIK